MKDTAQLCWCVCRSRGALAIALLVSVMGTWSCQKSVEPGGGRPPKDVKDTYNCRDRQIDVDPNAANGQGVVEDPVVVCGGHKVRWQEINSPNAIDWEVDFVNSPFTKGETTIKKGDKDPSPVLSPNDDTAFKYTIIVNKVKHDPQIVLMGK